MSALERLSHSSCIVFAGCRPKMLEYNGDTATVILESGPAQASWFKHVVSKETQANQSNRPVSQFNSIDADLVIAWPRVFSSLLHPKKR